MAYRPGGFPEYNPAEQKIFDNIQDIIRHVFEQRNFEHIWTPAVESNDILLKGGDTIANEIFGLVGLKDFSNANNDSIKETLKKYSLHFDLTVPFARYVLDHMNDLVFPFKRYQIQPVWRGERQQRGRFKELWQCDVDSIRRSGSDVGSRYGIETIATLQSAIKKVLNQFTIAKDFVSHISHIGVTKLWLNELLNNDTEKVQLIVNLLDKYHKRPHEEFVIDLAKIVDINSVTKIENLIKEGDYSILSHIKGYDNLDQTIKTLNQLGCSVTYDFSIVRGLGYYTGVVFETFISEEQALGSVCSGGGYEDFTKFIDPKQVFSGIGGSIGLSRLMEIIIDNSVAIQVVKDSYMFINFEDSFDKIVDLYNTFITNGKTCEIYPTPVKLGKQFEYADKKGITHCIIMGAGELEQGIYKIKNLSTGEEDVININQ